MTKIPAGIRLVTTQTVQDECLDHVGATPAEIMHDIGGPAVRVVSEAKAEKADYVLCMLATVPLAMDGNLTGPCCVCARSLQFRPHAPKGPPKICVECAEWRMARPN